MNVVVLRGVPGSGKSTYVAKNLPEAKVVSADKFFMVDGEYKFNPTNLPNAHAACLREYMGHVMLGYLDDTVVVDNTNTTAVEIAPYAAIALAFGCELEVVTLECDPKVAAARNIHGVPEGGVLAMHKRLVEAQLMPWWQHRVVTQ